MYTMHRWTIILLTFSLVMGCSVMSREIQDQALPSLPLDQLIRNVEQFNGQTVILGGYIVSVENLKDQSRIVAVQAPLGIGQRPKSKDLTQGRMILHYKGFIDPEVYTKDRQITIGGRILSSSAKDANARYPYLEIETDQIHLWPKPKPESYDPFWEDDFFWTPYPWWWHPYGYHRYRD